MSAPQDTYRVLRIPWIYKIFQRRFYSEKPPNNKINQVAERSVNLKPIEEERLEKISQQKLVKVALLGRPNAGKSTLINAIMNLAVCGVSRKSHTTRVPQKTAIIRGDTQIIFVDTPGLVTRKEKTKFKLEKSFLNWKDDVFSKVDIVGLVFDAQGIKGSQNFNANLRQNLGTLPESLPVFLLLNKVDLIKDCSSLLEKIHQLNESRVDIKSPVPLRQITFTRTFLISALKNVGIDEVVDYLLQIARPGKWIFQSGETTDTSLDVLISNLLRSKMLERIKYDVGYACTYEVEFLEENNLGEIVCVILIKCSKPKHEEILRVKSKHHLLSAAKELEADLYYIIGKFVRVKVVVVTQKNEKENYDGIVFK